MKIFIAGPMAGKPRWNFDAFAKATTDLRAAGFEVISPSELDLEEGFQPDRPIDEFTDTDIIYALRRDVRHVADVDCVALLDGWEESDEARLHVHIGTSLELMVAPVETFLTMRRAAARNRKATK